MKANRLKSKKGQNTAEYMLLLLLIGGGSILAFKTFGKGIINRFASVTSIMTGGQKQTLDTNVISSATGADINFTSFEENGKNGAAGSAPAPATGN